MDETVFFEDTIHLLKYHTLLLDNVNKILNFSETDIRVNIELVGLLREKKYASNFSYESYLKSHAFETWIKVFIPTENNNKECAKKIKKIMPNIYDKALSDFNITLAVYEGNSEDRLLFLFNIELCLKNKTTDYAQNGDHFWNLAIRTSQLKNINDMHVTGYIFTKNQELLKVMEYAISRKLKCGYKDSFLEVIIKR